MDIGTLGVDALPTGCDTARPNGTAIFEGFAFGTFMSTAGPASAPLRLARSPHAVSTGV